MRQCTIPMFEYTLNTTALINYAFIMHMLSNYIIL